jgi:amino acid adenylation domain-containing protein/non-ribosomal peptide synthase protein (TIGR01720 family)
VSAPELGIAIIGMDGRFPGAPDLPTFWRNLAAGIESVTFATPEELRAAGLPAELTADPRFVPATPRLDGIESFDADFFGFTPREARALDPQQRLFLECAWHALENAGRDPARAGGRVGVYAGCALSSYLLLHLMSAPSFRSALTELQTTLGNDKDYLATRVSYKLGLGGPSVAVQSACSTSLVAVHLACQALLDDECDLALAGGVSIELGASWGYLHQKEGILSPDGHCRAFDARGEGTIFGSGVGVVVLKRLADAVADGDPIRAVLLGSAINNDGAAKVGYTAPSSEGQARVVRAALRVAGVAASEIDAIEAHGTGTSLGDPIEVEALTRVFRETSARRGDCALGTVKTNIGHLNTAAGVAGLIKTVLALEHEALPPSLHFEQPNPRIDFAHSPFFVNTELRPWRRGSRPRRAGVSSFGIGGTNAHVVVEEAPAASPSAALAREHQLLVLSARTPSALTALTDRLADHLREHPETPLGDAAWTLQVGRKPFPYRHAVVAATVEEAIAACSAPRGEAPPPPRGRPTLAFLLPGQGAQHPGMARGLYRTEPVFRQEIDRAAAALAGESRLDLRALLFPPAGEEAAAAARLTETELAQPALFAVEYALAAWYRHLGVEPAALLGHSLGEWTAATLAGVFRFEDALRLVAQRGRFMQARPRGAMLAVALSGAELVAELPRELALAAENAPDAAVASGPVAAIEALASRLAARGIETRRLHTSHAFHSADMDATVAQLAEAVARVPRSLPTIPFVSNVTGTWITPEEAVDPLYWGRQLRATVRFSEGLGTLAEDPDLRLVEVGPGRTLTALARRRPKPLVAIATLPHPDDVVADERHALEALGRLWSAGVEIDWPALAGPGRRRRIVLPGYPFERRRYWIEAGPALTAGAASEIEDPQEAPSTPAPDGFDAPAGEVEEAIAVVWRELLGRERVGRHDDFLELGGHSLLATQMIPRLERSLGLELSVRALFEARTIANLARTVEATRGTTSPPASPDRPPLAHDAAGRHEPFPLTDVQQAYWIGRSGDFALGGVATHVYTELEGQGVDLERVTAACRRLIARHDMLRAVVDADGRQRVLADVPDYEVRLLDLVHEAPAVCASALAELRAEMSHQVLPADRWPLFELRATHLPGERTRLHLSFDFLLADAWSIHRLAQEWEAAYRGDEAEVALGITFRDAVLAELALAESAAHERDLDYWRRRLATLPAGPDLPLARDPASLDRPRFERRAARLDADRWARLKTRATSAGLTASSLLVAAFAETLGAWARHPRFLLTLTLFRRLPLHPDMDRVIGDFTSLTLLAVDLGAGATFLERARHLQSQLLTDLDHRLVGGVRVLRELAHGGEVAAGPRAPVVFTSTLGLPASPATTQATTSRFETVYAISQTPQVWLDHQVAEVAGELAYNWDSVEDLFPTGLLDEMFAAYHDFLEALADTETFGTARHDFLPRRQRALREQVNATAVPRTPGLIHDAACARFFDQPDALAVVSPERRLDYRELGSRVQDLARRLRAAGAQPEQLVAVVMTKGWEQVVAVLAILEAGAAYLPIDPQLPAERLRFLLEHGECRLAVTQPGLRDTLGWPASVTPLTVSGDDPLPALEGRPAPVQRPDQLAYVIFTSGSTGMPKGVMIEHRAAANTLEDIARRWRIGPADRVLALSSLSFDLSVWDVFGVLGAGGTVVFPAAEATRHPELWHAQAVAEGVTVWNTVPALFQLLVDWSADANEQLPPSLRLAMLSGDWLPVTLPDRARRLAAPDFEIASLGGATEAAIWSIVYPIGAVDPAWPSIPYGRPLENQRFHVFDEDFVDRPEGVAGELFIAGDGLARGYWRDAEKTAARFPHHPRTGERLYRTGDLGRYLPSGDLEFLGREDLQVKIQGYRIELGEVEAALASHPGVRAGAVAAQGERHHLRLVGYFVPAAGSVDEGELRRHLAERLPGYMVPVAFVALDRLPLTGNGKVDRKALPVPGRDRAAAPTHAAGSVTRGRLAEIWSEVLQVPRVEPEDNFFALGGDSILALQVVSRARQAGLALSARQLFEFPTLAELAAVVGEAQAPAPAAVAPIVGPVPLTPIQHWFFATDPPDPGHWNQAVLLRPTEELDFDALARAVEAVFQHHDALRLRFVRGAAGWRQWNAPPGNDTLTTIDLGTPSAEERSAVFERAAGRVQTSLDLAIGPLGRVVRLNLGGGLADRLLLVFHHLVVDGLSWRILLEDLAIGYRQARAGATVTLPDKSAPFRAWAEAVTDLGWRRSDDALVEYWTGERWRAAPDLPLDHPEGITENLEGSVEIASGELDSETTAVLLGPATVALRASIQELLLTALARALASWRGPGPVLVEIEAHGRDGLAIELDISRTVGWFTALYPVLLPVRGHDLIADLVTVKEELRSLPDQGTSYGVLRHLAADPRVTERFAPLPKAEVAFNYLGQFDQAFDAGSWFAPASEPTGPWSSPRQPRRHALFVFASVEAGRLRFGWAFSPALHERPRIAALAESFAAELRGLVAAAGAPVLAGVVTPSDFPLVDFSADELQAALGAVDFGEDGR